MNIIILALALVALGLSFYAYRNPGLKAVKGPKGEMRMARNNFFEAIAFHARRIWLRYGEKTLIWLAFLVGLTITGAISSFFGAVLFGGVAIGAAAALYIAPIFTLGFAVVMLLAAILCGVCSAHGGPMPWDLRYHVIYY